MERLRFASCRLHVSHLESAAVMSQSTAPTSELPHSDAPVRSTLRSTALSSVAPLSDALRCLR